jgi:hypothetical protein
MNYPTARKTAPILVMAGFLAMTALARADGDPSDSSSIAGAPPAPDLPRVEVLATDPFALRGASTGAFTLIRDGAVDAELVVWYTLTGSAENGVDYIKLEDHLSIPAGFLATDLVIQPIATSPNAGNRNVILTLKTHEGYRLTKHKHASVVIVDDVYNDQAPKVALTSPADGVEFKLPCVVTIQAEATDPDGTVKKVSFYDGDRHLGFADKAPFTLLWTNPPAGAHTLFARAIDGQGKSALSAPVHITVVNLAPTIKLINPVNDTTYPVKSDVLIKAEAADADGGVVSVKVYTDGRLLTTIKESPYEVLWRNVPPGPHKVTVRAEDAFGLTAEARAEFTVINAPPTVKLLSPAEGASFPAQSDITIEASAEDADGAVARVGFWADRRYLGSDATKPYSITWKKATAGEYVLKAVAMDEYGASATSAPVKIKVGKKNN